MSKKIFISADIEGVSGITSWDPRPNMAAKATKKHAGK